MKYLNKEKNTRNPLLIPVILLLATVIILTVILILPESIEKNDHPSTAPTMASETMWEEYNQSVDKETELTAQNATVGYYEATGPAVETEPSMSDMTISTPFATLHYPGQWKEYLRVEQIPMGAGTIVLFLGRVGDVEVELFNIAFGGTDGIPIGIYTPDNGAHMDVTATMVAFTPDESWSEENSNRLMAMQEAMNYVVEKLLSEPSIIPAV